MHRLVLMSVSTLISMLCPSCASSGGKAKADDITIVRNLIEHDDQWSYILRDVVMDVDLNGVEDSLSLVTQGSLRVPAIELYSRQGHDMTWHQDSVYDCELDDTDEFPFPLRFDATYLLVTATSRPLLVEVVQDFELKVPTGVIGCQIDSDHSLDTLFSFTVTRIPNHQERIGDYLTARQIWASLNEVTEGLQLSDELRDTYEKRHPVRGYETSVGYIGTYHTRLIKVVPDTVWSKKFTSEFVFEREGDLLGVYGGFESNDSTEWFGFEIWNLTSGEMLEEIAVPFSTVTLNVKSWYHLLSRDSDDDAD